MQYVYVKILQCSQCTGVCEVHIALVFTQVMSEVGPVIREVVHITLLFTQVISEVMHTTLYTSVCISACYPNGTVTFTNPNTILYTDAMAVQFEGTSSAIICTVSKSGSTVYITGCSMVSDTNISFHKMFGLLFAHNKC